MKNFLKRYQGFITNCLALTAMLGTCFGAVVFIQEAPNKAIAALAQATQEGDAALEKRIVQEIQAVRSERGILKEARDREIMGMRTEIRNEFISVKQSLERIEQRQYDQRKRAEREVPSFFRPTGG